MRTRSSGIAYIGALKWSWWVWEEWRTAPDGDFYKRTQQGVEVSAVAAEAMIKAIRNRWESEETDNQ